MSDLDFPCLNSVTLVGRVKHRWDPKSEKAPLKLVVETYKVIRDGRKIPRSDVVVLWGSYLLEKAAGAAVGSIVSLTCSIDSSKDAEGNWKDELRCETFGPVSGGGNVQPAPRSGGNGSAGFSPDESIPFSAPGPF